MYFPQKAPAHLDTDGLRKWTEDEFERLGRAYNEDVSSKAQPITDAVAYGKRAVPPGFVGMDVGVLNVQRGYGPGGVLLNRTPMVASWYRFFRMNTPSVVYAAPGASGVGTQFDPCSITTAMNTSTAKLVYLSRGVYTPFSIAYTDAAHAAGVIPKIVVGDWGVEFRQGGPEVTTTTFTLDPGTGANVYKSAAMAVSGSQRPGKIFRKDTFNSLNEPPFLRKFSSPSALGSSGQEGWAWDALGANLYIRMSDLAGGWVDVNSFKVVLGTHWTDSGGVSSRIYSLGVPLALIGPMTLMGAKVQVENDASSTLQGLWMDGGPGTIFCHGSMEEGIQVYGGLSFVKNVHVHASTYDNFNWNAAKVTNALARVTEVDCIGISAGDFETNGVPAAPNLNGSSAHDNVHILRTGGVYVNAYGPIIADVGAGYSWLIRNVMRDVLDPQGIGMDFETGRFAYLDQNFVSGCNISLQNGGGATIRDFAGVYSGKATGYTNYNPLTGT